MSDLLSRLVDRATDPRAAIVDARGEHSYARIVARSAAVARHLRRSGAIGPGARIAILAPPSAEFVVGLYGILRAGGCALVLSALHPFAETQYFCADAGVTTILVADAYAGLATPLTAAGFDCHSLDAIADDGAQTQTSSADEAAPPEPHADALQLYTSGTTGRPKGAVLTHENLGVQQRLVGEAWGFHASDRLLHALPLHHMHGLAIALLTALGAGATTRLTTFDARAIWDAMTDATVFMGVPSMYHRLFVAFDAATTDERTRWSAAAARLRLATSGSAALPVTLAERWRVITGRIPLERFGMTEIGVGITNALEGERFAGCVGLPLPTVEARIVDDAGNDAETGELWIRGPSVFAGYHQRPEETAKAFVLVPGERTWFRTGDTVTRDASLAGAPFRILGRTSVDILKSGGYKLSALEIEEVLREHLTVGEVAVVGVPDEAWGERVVACVVPPSATACDPELLRAFVRERLAPYKVPKEILVVDDLPKNALGKVVKPDLVRRLHERSKGK